MARYVDVTVQLGDVPTRVLVDALLRRGFDLRIRDDAFVEQTRVLPVVHGPTRIPADIVLAVGRSSWHANLSA